jgi:hypothetical protein
MKAEEQTPFLPNQVHWGIMKRTKSINTKKVDEANGSDGKNDLQ